MVSQLELILAKQSPFFYILNLFKIAFSCFFDQILTMAAKYVLILTLCIMSVSTVLLLDYTFESQMV